VTIEYDTYLTSVYITEWTTGVRLPVRACNFSPSHYVQTSSGANLASYPMVTGGKAAGD